MITFKAIVISNNRRKNGTYPVKIRVTFKGVSRRLPTTMVATSTDLTRSLKIKNPTILNKADDLISRMRAIVYDISPFDLLNQDVDWVVAFIKAKMTSASFHLDFFAWADSFIETKSPGTRLVYQGSLRAFERFLGSRELDINAISKSMLIDFIDFIENEPKMIMHARTKKYIHTSHEKIAFASSYAHILHLSHIFNAAKDRYNDEDEGKIVIPRSPFKNLSVPKPNAQGQKNIGHDLMQKIISYNTDHKMMRIALDIFIVSFGLMGANLADLYNQKPFSGQWIYNRQKTRDRRFDKAEMRVDIPDEIRPFIDRLQNATGDWWLPVLHCISTNKNGCTANVNRALNKWCEQEGIAPFTFYAARHTWASLARKAGVEKATIDECLAHIGNFDMADIYAERSWDLLAEANKKVLSLFDWSDADVEKR